MGGWKTKPKRKRKACVPCRAWPGLACWCLHQIHSIARIGFFGLARGGVGSCMLSWLSCELFGAGRPANVFARVLKMPVAGVPAPLLWPWHMMLPENPKEAPPRAANDGTSRHCQIAIGKTRHGYSRNNNQDDSIRCCPSSKYRAQKPARYDVRKRKEKRKPNKVNQPARPRR